MNAMEFLSTYSGTHPFLLSVKQGAETYGGLTPRQEAAVEKFMQPKAQPPQTAAVKSFSPGQVIEIPNWLAKKFAEQLQIPTFFRNIELVDVQAETHKSILATIKFSAKPAVNCHICGRDLENPISQATGIGPICADRLGIDRATYADAEKTLLELAKRTEAQGIVGPLWIAKSQITLVEA